ncbi:MAG: TetR/AcrR family transcriptional regulator [Lachnospiraceae bacterium]|nr:TetR/AcrR family transcriptional regulator [Lachnospiraceae bacterium]
MPRDKTVTNAKIIRYMKEEFLTYGYEQASLNRVSAKVGITTAGLYKHFKGKEDMFYYLVKDVLAAFETVTDSSESQMETDVNYNPFDDDWALFWVDFIYEHYDSIKLLICCSEGSIYEGFEDKLIEYEETANKRYAKILTASGKKTKKISDLQWHILATAYVHLIFEIVRHDMTKAEALQHMRFVSTLLYPGWKESFGLG